jgi:mRNA-degrading endonuclease RelE of RelBE toxin-antitoxin system
MHEIVYSAGVVDDLHELRAYDRTAILDKIEEQLRFQPTMETKNRKPLLGFVPPWEHNPPVWELRVGEYRVYYDVNEEERLVSVAAIRRKRPHATTEEAL